MTTVLVVDDQPGMRETICEMLEVVGYTTIAAADGNEALELARQHDGRIDVVVTDVRMPGRDGVELLLELGNPPPQVILITAYTDDERLTLASGARPFAIAHKPVPPAHLLELVEKAAGSEGPVASGTGG